MKIQKLPKDVSSLIRTGVTVTSPAQCIVELVHNGLDAGATSIAVCVNLNSFKLQVVDNGCGMNLEQLDSLGPRYMTSKCHDLSDLRNNLHFYGFRGEALASLIETCGLLVIVSRPRNSSETYCKGFSYGKAQNAQIYEKHRPSCGTTVSVNDFMCNMPVRRNRINEAVDLEEIRFHLECIALVNPQVSFRLNDLNKGKLLFHKHKCMDVLQAFKQIFGSLAAESLSSVNHSSGCLKVSGYIGKLPFSQKNRQFLYVNKKLINKSKLHRLVNIMLSKSSILRANGPWRHKPISELSTANRLLAFPSPVRRNKYAVFLLNIECPPSEYDLCQDPKKTIVEFRNWDRVLDCVEKAIRLFIQKEQLAFDTSNPQPWNLSDVADLLNASCIKEILEQKKQADVAKRKAVEPNKDIVQQTTGNEPNFPKAIYSKIAKRKAKINFEEVNSNVCSSSHSNNNINSLHDSMGAEDSSSRETITSVENLDQGKLDRPENHSILKKFKFMKNKLAGNKKLDTGVDNVSDKTSPVQEMKDIGTQCVGDTSCVETITDVSRKKTQPCRYTDHKKIEKRYQNCESTSSNTSANKTLDKATDFVQDNIIIDPLKNNMEKKEEYIPNNCFAKFINPKFKSKSNDFRRELCSKLKCTVNEENKTQVTTLVGETNDCISHRMDVVNNSISRKCLRRRKHHHLSRSNKIKSLKLAIKKQESYAENFSLPRKENSQNHCTSEDFHSKFVIPKIPCKNFSLGNSDELNNSQLRNTQRKFKKFQPIHFSTPLPEATDISHAPLNESKGELSAIAKDYSQAGNEISNSNFNLNQEHIRNLKHINNTSIVLHRSSKVVESPSVIFGNHFEKSACKAKTCDSNKLDINNLLKMVLSNNLYDRTITKKSCQDEFKQNINSNFQNLHSKFTSKSPYFSNPEDNVESLNQLDHECKEPLLFPNFSQNNIEHQNKILSLKPSFKRKLVVNAKNSKLSLDLDLDKETININLSPYSLSHHKKRKIAPVTLPVNGKQSNSSDPFTITSNSFENNGSFQSVSDFSSNMKLKGTSSSEFILRDLKSDLFHERNQIMSRKDDAENQHSENFFEYQPKVHNNQIIGIKSKRKGCISDNCSDHIMKTNKFLQPENLETKDICSKSPYFSDLQTEGRRSNIICHFDAAVSKICESDVNELSKSQGSKNNKSVIEVLGNQNKLNSKRKCVYENQVNANAISLTNNISIHKTTPSRSLKLCGADNSSIELITKIDEKMSLLIDQIDSQMKNEFVDGKQQPITNNPTISINNVRLKGTDLPYNILDNESVKISHVFPMQLNDHINQSNVNAPSEFVCETQDLLNAYDNAIKQIQDFQQPEELEKFKESKYGDSLHYKKNSGKWIKQRTLQGKSFYFDPESGITTYHPIEAQQSFFMSERCDFVPKGMSQKLKDVPSKLTALTPNTRKEFHLALVDKERGPDEDSVFKWKHVADTLTDDFKSDLTNFLTDAERRLAFNEFNNYDVSSSAADFSMKIAHIIGNCQYDRQIFSGLKVVGQWDKKFIIVYFSLKKGEYPHMIGIFDQHAVHERIRLEKLMKDYIIGNRFVSSEVKPEVEITLNSKDFRIFTNFLKEFDRLGLEVKSVDESKCAVRLNRIPSCLFNRELREKSRGTSVIKQTLTKLISEQVESLISLRGIGSEIPNALKEIIDSEACKGAIKFGDALTSEECVNLLNDLHYCDIPFFCAHGRPAFAPIFDLRDLL